MLKKRRKYINKKINIRRTRSINKKSYVNIIAIVIIIILALIFIKLGLGAREKLIYQYKINKNSDYVVVLKKNNFYQTTTLPANLHYASKSIDDFIINFEYNFKGSGKIDIEYNYGITAELIGTVKDEYEDKEVWNKNFELLPNKSDKQANKDSFVVKEKVSIDYEKYINLVSQYESAYGIKIDAALRLRFNISYKTNLSNYGINTDRIDDVIELNIPITVTEVNKNYENESITNITPPMEKIRTIEYICYTIAILLIVVSIIYIIKMNKVNPQEKYKRKIKSVLNYYKDIIVTVNNKPNLNNLKMMELIALDDLIDVAEQNNCNIIHYEDVIDEISYLYVIVGEYVYYKELVIE